MEILHAFCIDDVVDFSTLDGTVAVAATRMRLKYIGFCHIECHRLFVARRVDNAMIEWFCNPELDDWFPGEDVKEVLSQMLLAPLPESDNEDSEGGSSSDDG